MSAKDLIAKIPKKDMPNFVRGLQVEISRLDRPGFVPIVEMIEEAAKAYLGHLLEKEAVAATPNPVTGYQATDEDL